MQNQRNNEQSRQSLAQRAPVRQSRLTTMTNSGASTHRHASKTDTSVSRVLRPDDRKIRQSSKIALLPQDTQKGSKAKQSSIVSKLTPKQNGHY